MTAIGAVRVVEAVLALGCLAAAVVWGRSTARLHRARVRMERSVERHTGDPEAAGLSRAAHRKELHTTLLYVVLAAGLATGALAGPRWTAAPLVLSLGPLTMSFGYGRRFLADAEITEQRSMLLRRAEEVMLQADLAPQRWAARLAPAQLPEMEGFDVGTVYEPGTGTMAGDFYDLHRTGGARVAVVIGDVTGHGIEPSITAFQVKYLLRVFLERYRDPAQAVEELNAVLWSASQSSEELISLACVLFDLDAGTLRYCSAGHPAGWLWQGGDLRPLRSTGPLLNLDGGSRYHSFELRLAEGDLLVLYTDGLTEARNGPALFGEDRVAQILRRDPSREPSFLAKALLEAARDFSAEPLSDDVAVVAVRRVA